jgi:AbiV family abortive infection protein
MKRRLNQYSGKLSAKQIAEGMNAARENAKRLVADARLLHDNGRHASALALAILSIEEVGKENILRGIALASNESDLKSGWRHYRSHTKKNAHWLLLNLVKSGAGFPTDFAVLFDENAEHPQLLENAKQVSFYTDCLGNSHWSVPEEVVDGDLALVIIEMAGIQTQTREITEEEIELWIQYLKPHRKGTNAEREAALLEWDKEVRRRGIVGGTDTMEEFFREGIKVPPNNSPHA